MATVGSYEAKTHLPKLLERVARGERITITKHGVPVAVLTPPEPRAGVDPFEVAQQLRRFRKGIRRGKTSIREMIDAGRR